MTPGKPGKLYQNHNQYPNEKFLHCLDQYQQHLFFEQSLAPTCPNQKIVDNGRAGLFLRKGKVT